MFCVKITKMKTKSKKFSKKLWLYERRTKNTSKIDWLLTRVEHHTATAVKTLTTIVN